LKYGCPALAGFVQKMDADWRAATYLSVGQIFLLANSVLRKPFKQRRLLGTWGTAPELNYLSAPEADYEGTESRNDLGRWARHCGPGVVANSYLEGTGSEVDTMMNILVLNASVHALRIQYFSHFPNWIGQTRPRLAKLRGTRFT
jgi:phosphoketolase